MCRRQTLNPVLRHRRIQQMGPATFVVSWLLVVQPQYPNFHLLFLSVISRVISINSCRCFPLCLRLIKTRLHPVRILRQETFEHCVRIWSLPDFRSVGRQVPNLKLRFTGFSLRRTSVRDTHFADAFRLTHHCVYYAIIYFCIFHIDVALH